ncbi:hypothetical protein [Legionella sp. km772]|uniref:hypothetical protein n=1 Tax=Legionella sp. km772 TaxID=2498111 RepID=UPI000F8EDDE2|nr:hypothetical protein [Legionella sp. km772]RUR10426.1 hypothetical protein ELY15_08120 [Legionella sp. km772]
MSPYHHLKLITEQFPNTWKLIDNFRMEKEQIPDWPEWCLLPKSGWAAIVAEEYRHSYLSPKQIKEIAILAAVAAWRYNQGIYRFQRDVYPKILRYSLKNKFNPHLFYRLPEWSIYVKTPQFIWNNCNLAGFWCYLEWDLKEKIPTLKFLLNSFKLEVISLPLDKQVLNALNRPTNKQLILGGENNYAPLFVMVSLVYFICKTSAEIGTRGRHPEKVKPKLFKGSFKLFPVNQPTLWNIDSL